MLSHQRFSRWFTWARVIADIVTVPVVIVAAYSLKFKINYIFNTFFEIDLGKVYPHAQVEPYFENTWLLMALIIVTFYFSGVYRRFNGIMPEIDEFIQLVKGITLVTLEVVLATILFEIIPASRYVLVYIWIMGVLLFSLSRFVIQRVEASLLKRGVGVNRALVMGSDAVGQDIVEKMIVFPRMGYRYMGSLDSKAPDTLHFHLKKHYKKLGGWADYRHVIPDQEITHVFISQSYPKSFSVSKLAAFCKTHQVELNILSGDMTHLSNLGQIFEFDGLPFIRFHESRSPLGFRILKRTMDIAAALFFLTLTLPITVLIALLIKITSPSGPIFYVQERVTQGNRVFGMIKFRTMVPDAESKSGPVMVNEEKDTRYLPFGAFMRKNSIDEWPQLINVLKGDMSLVGPRPERPFFIEQFEKDIPNFSLRHEVKGGLTGWAQINGRSVLTRRPEHKLKYDLYYIKNKSIVLDIKIILKTLFVVFKQEEAY